MTFTHIAQIIVSILLILAVLVQANGTSLGRSFGGFNAAYHTKKGAERALFYATIALSFLFALFSLLNLSSSL